MVPIVPIVIVILLMILLSGIFTVKQQSAALVERFGRFMGVKGSGLQFKLPFVDRVAGRISLKIQQLDVLVETKTKDNVFVKLKVSVQFVVSPDKVYEAFYKLESSTKPRVKDPSLEISEEGQRRLGGNILKVSS